MLKLICTVSCYSRKDFISVNRQTDNWQVHVCDWNSSISFRFCCNVSLCVNI